MTLQVTPYADVELYFPIPIDSTPTEVFINDLSFFDINQQIFVASYTFQVGSTYYNMNSFVAYPQSVSLYLPIGISTSQSNLATSISSVVFRNENIYDETAYALIGNNLVTYSDQAFTTSSVSSKSVTGSQYVVFWNNDVLIIYTQPYSIVVYSVNQNKFFTYTIPTNLESSIISSISVSFLGGYLYAGILTYSSTTGDVYAYLLSSQFSYANGQMSIVISNLVYSVTSSSVTIVYLGVAVRSNGNYVVLIITSTVLSTSSTGEIIFIAYNVNTGTSSTVSYNIGVTQVASIVSVSVYTISTTSIITSNIDMAVSIYAYNVFVLFFGTGSPSFTVLSFNIKTLSIETITVSTSSFQTNLSSGFFIQGNIVYIPISWSSTIQYGSTYYVPIRFLFYQITTSEMIGIQLTDYQLYKDTLTISGIVKYLQTGDPVANAYVTIYEYLSVQGNQFAISKSLVQTQTNSNGQFTLTYHYTKAPPYANIVVTASVDPIMVETVIPVAPVSPPQPYYPNYYSS